MIIGQINWQLTSRSVMNDAVVSAAAAADDDDDDDVKTPGGT